MPCVEESTRAIQFLAESQLDYLGYWRWFYVEAFLDSCENVGVAYTAVMVRAIHC